MATRMEKQTFGTVKAAQRRRHFEGCIRHALQERDFTERRRTGCPAGFLVEDVYVGPDIMSVTGDERAARAGAELFRQAGLLNVEVYEHCSRPGTWIAAGSVR